MALDHALAQECLPGEGVLRLYGWSRPTVSFGRNEPARGRYDERLAEALGIAFVRRPTGGRAVLHDDEVTYALVAPLRSLGGLREAYVRIHRGLVAGLHALGAPAELASGEKAVPPDAGPCFQRPAPGEVTLAGRKLVGSAQARVGDALLQHGSVLLRGDQGWLARLAGGSGDAHPPATLAEALPALDRKEVVERISTSLRLALGGSWSERGYGSREVEAARALQAGRYGCSEWTWRS